MNASRKNYFLNLLITCVVVIACGFLMPKVNVNSDMRKYLPDDSRMRSGIEILDKEFPASQMDGADVMVMFTDLPDSLRLKVQSELEALEPVDAVSSRTDDDGSHTLYELGVSKSIDQKRFGQEISRKYGDKVIVETSQDGATPPISVLIIAGSLILLILIVMSESWLAPLVYMLATGLAVVINIGTNYFLESVSITTNYIVAILQLVLSLDYSIILMNRFRQERDRGLDPIAAMNAAIPKAAPSITSSAVTTIVGLLMLLFMKLKIGMDMGLVLAKGVVCSLICNFTALPGIILLTEKWIRATMKKSFVVPTDPLARFGTRHRVTLVVVFLGFFFGSYFLHNRTVISFSTNSQSKINEFFPKKNLVVVAYDNDDEEKIIELADSLLSLDSVESIISYPTMLRKAYTAEQMTEALKGASSEMGKQGGVSIPAEAEKFLTSEMIRLVYYMKYNGSDDIKISFPDLAAFIKGPCMTSPLTRDFIDEPMKEKLGMLDAFEEQEEETSEEQTPQQESAGSNAQEPQQKSSEQTASATKPKSDNASSSSSSKVVVPVVTKKVAGGYSIISFVKKLSPRSGEDAVRAILPLVDTTRLRRQMDVAQMSAFIGSTTGQTKMVYSFSKSKSKTMSPLEYVHFLSDDLFNRKALSSMVSASQKQGLNLRKKVMDYANSDARISAAEIASLMTGLGISGIDEDEVRSLMGDKPSGTTKTTTSQTSTDKGSQASTDKTDKAAQTSSDKTAQTSTDKTDKGSQASSSQAETSAADSLHAAADSATTGAAAADSATTGAATADSAATGAATADSLSAIVPVKDSSAADNPADSTADKSADSTAVTKTVTAQTTAPAQTDNSQEVKQKPNPAAPRKTKEELRQEFFMEMMEGGKEYNASRMAKNFKRLGEDIDPDLVKMMYLYYGSVHEYNDSLTMTVEGLVSFLTETVFSDSRFAAFVDESSRESFAGVAAKMEEGKDMLRSDSHSIAVIISAHPDESSCTYDYIDKVDRLCASQLQKPYYLIGESVMFNEMKNGFRREMIVITLLTVLAIFVIVALTFRSIIVPLLLVMTVMSGVFVNVWFSGFGGNTMLYLAYLIVQSILMGATIDYGILFTSYYREKRQTMDIPEAVKEAYRGSIRTILTSGLIMCVAPGVMSLLVVDNVAISAIVGCLSIGAFVSVMLILFVVPGLLAAFDKLVVPSKVRRDPSSRHNG